MAEHIDLGKQGELAAVNYLIKKGYRIIEQNWKFGKNEIDIIAKDGKYIVVVEVKTRNSNYFAEPETNVTREKQKILVRAANAYVRYKQLNDEVRFDVIAILAGQDGDHINHIIDAFYPTIS